MSVSKNSRKQVPVGKMLPSAPSVDDIQTDRPALEALTIQISAGRGCPKGHREGRDPLERAQKIREDVRDMPGRRDRVALARQALPISDLSADSWILLAEGAAKNIVEAKTFYERAVVAGRQAIVSRYGEDLFEDEDGDAGFWLILDTRPYMRARAGLARCLWEGGEREEAAGHLQDMLRLNPDDNQGLRSILKSWMFALNDFKGVDEILTEYSEEDDCADWCYSKAFLLFRQSGGKASGAINVLKYAMELNPFVPDLLLGAKPMPKSLPAHYGIGSQEEAVLYVDMNRQNWSATKGALQWLAENS